MGFYCQKLCGGDEYKQGQINEAISDCAGMSFTPNETQEVIKEVRRSFHVRCITQCKTCAGIVTETRRINKEKRVVLFPHSK